jgi:hypothetical protein
MELVRKFHEESTCYVIPIDKLQVEVKHLILRAERVNTSYGPSIVLTLRGPEFQRYKVYLPRCYCGLITDDDVTAINDRQVVLHLVFKGTCSQSNQHLLNIVQDNCM